MRFPHWAEDAKRSYSMIQARAESLEEKPTYRGLIKSCRCAVLVSGFYEWKRDGKDKKPYKVEHESGHPMIMAGLWTRNEAMRIDSYTVITTAASPTFAWLHDRQPAILQPDQVNLWVDGPWDDAKALTGVFLGPLAATAVSKDVGNVRNNYPGLLEPID